MAYARISHQSKVLPRIIFMIFGSMFSFSEIEKSCKISIVIAKTNVANASLIEADLENVFKKKIN